MDFDLLLIQKMKRGSENAFDLFVRKYYEEIFKYCNCHCLDTSYAEDLTQETFLRFFEKLSDYRYMGKTLNYLYTIAGNLCRDYYRKTKESLLGEYPEDMQSNLHRSETEDILDKITIEAASYYSLRRIYAARMLLFGIVDIILITIFCTSAATRMNLMFSQLLIQFLFPMTVTTVICFGILCSRYPFGETAAMMMCIAWSAVWLGIILNEKIYAAITFPLWLTFIGIAFVFLAFTVYRTLCSCDHYWEVKINETGFR